LPDIPARAHQELALQVGLGGALLVTQGYASTEVERSYLRARELCLRVGETPELAPILWGLWLFYINRSRLDTARELGETLLRLAEHDPTLSVLAHNALGATALFAGAFVDSRRHLEEGIQRYTLNLRDARVFQRDLGVGCRMYAGLALWLLGYPDQAAARMQDGVMMASRVSHPFTLAFARIFAAWLSQMRRDVAGTLDQVEAALALATEHGFAQWDALGPIYRGWALAMRDKTEEGMTQLSRGIAALRGTSTALIVHYVLTLLAETSGHLGHIEEGLRSLDDAQAMLEQAQDRWWEAEIYRLRGVLLFQQSIAPQAEAEVWLLRALDVARTQQAKSLELRAATSLAHVWHAQGERCNARDLLPPVYGWFTEGFDTHDLREARALLACLSG